MASGRGPSAASSLHRSAVWERRVSCQRSVGVGRERWSPYGTVVNRQANIMIMKSLQGLNNESTKLAALLRVGGGELEALALDGPGGALARPYFCNVLVAVGGALQQCVSLLVFPSLGCAAPGPLMLFVVDLAGEPMPLPRRVTDPLTWGAAAARLSGWTSKGLLGWF